MAKILTSAALTEVSNKISHSTIKMVLFLDGDSHVNVNKDQCRLCKLSHKIQAYFKYGSTASSLDVKKQERILMWPFAVAFHQFTSVSSHKPNKQECSG